MIKNAVDEIFVKVIKVTSSDFFSKWSQHKSSE